MKYGEDVLYRTLLDFHTFEYLMMNFDIAVHVLESKNTNTSVRRRGRSQMIQSSTYLKCPIHRERRGKAVVYSHGDIPSAKTSSNHRRASRIFITVNDNKIASFVCVCVKVCVVETRLLRARSHGLAGVFNTWPSTARTREEGSCIDAFSLINSL